MVDKLGQEIKEGVIVAYPISVGSHSTSLRIGRVVKVETQTAKYWGDKETIVPVVFVRGIDDTYGFPTLCERNGRLGDLTKILVLSKLDLPDPYYTLLKGDLT